MNPLESLSDCTIIKKENDIVYKVSYKLVMKNYRIECIRSVQDKRAEYINDNNLSITNNEVEDYSISNNIKKIIEKEIKKNHIRGPYIYNYTPLIIFKQFDEWNHNVTLSISAIKSNYENYPLISNSVKQNDDFNSIILPELSSSLTILYSISKDNQKMLNLLINSGPLSYKYFRISELIGYSYLSNTLISYAKYIDYNKSMAIKNYENFITVYLKDCK